MSVLALMVEISLGRQPTLIKFRDRLWRWNDYLNDYATVIDEQIECFTDYYDINTMLRQKVEIDIVKGDFEE